MMIEYKSLATDTNNEANLTFTSLARTTALPPASELTLEQYVAACLDPVQRDTRASLVLCPNPPSGRGSDHDTIPAPYGVEAA